jgi:hypothetical protein
MSTAYLAPLSRTELDVLTADIEHGYRKAHIALTVAPLRPEALAAACGVAQDCMALMDDCYEESILRRVADMEAAAGA